MPEEPPANAGRRYGRRMFVIAWFLGLSLLYLFFSDAIEKQLNPNQAPATTALPGDIVQVTLLRNRYGHYLSSGLINDQPVTFMLDTGATNISIPAETARRIGLKKGQALSVNTANGVITVYRTRLESAQIGGIRLHGLTANINPHMKGDALLGMSFLKHLQFSQTGNELTLTASALP